MTDFPINPLYIDILVIQEAALLGVSVRTLQDWDQGRRKPSGAAMTLYKSPSGVPKYYGSWRRESLTASQLLPHGVCCREPRARFIVTNRADAPPDSLLDAASLDDESLDISVATYRSFVNEHPTQTNYFQPILDRLDVVPSRFDIRRNSIILEGKSDYYALRYSAKLTGRSDLPLLPGLGAGTFGALVALHVGWNLHFLFVLDGDRQGKVERKRYIEDFGIADRSITIISELVPGVTVIEDLLDEEAKQIIAEQLGVPGTPSKSQILRFFQERLASDKVEHLNPGFEKAATAILDALEAKLNSGA